MVDSADKQFKLSHMLKTESLRDDYLNKLQQKIKCLSHFIKEIELDEDPEYYKSLNKEYASLLKKVKSKVQRLIFKIIHYVNQSALLEDIKDFDKISDRVDDMLEAVSDNIDIIKGTKKMKKDAELEQELLEIKQNEERKKMHLELKSRISSSLVDEFDIDNSYYPIIPKIVTKPHMIKELVPEIADARRMRLENKEKFRSIEFALHKECKEMVLFEHPYKDEITSLMMDFANRIDDYNKFFRTNRQYSFELIKNTSGLLSQPENLNNLLVYNKILLENQTYHGPLTHYSFEPLPLNSTLFVYVDTEDTLSEMIREISQSSTEIAVDLEHHSQESYLGITCLIQISTRYADYVIDAIKLRSSLHELNEIFTNPRIIKVFHGADYDIEWLQKDFGVYVVNMFDTGQASRVLQLPSYSLAYLLSTFANVTADKKYQLADWRIRPLPYEMLKYAREDTHYLLFIFDELRKKLIQRSIIKNDDILNSLLIVIKKSNEMCLKQFMKKGIKSQEYFSFIARNMTHYSKKQISILKLLYKFRDYAARKFDVSPNYMLSNKNMCAIAKLDNFENVYANLDKNSHFRKFVPELLKLIEVKLKKIATKVDHNQVKTLENNFIATVKERLSSAKLALKEKKIVSKPFELNYKIEEIPSLKEKKKVSPLGISIGERKFEPQDVQEYDQLVKSFNSFNLITFLKTKHKINIEVKQKDKMLTSKTKQKELTESKPTSKLPNEENIKIPSHAINPEKFLQTKRKGQITEMIDLTDNSKLYKHVKEINSEDEDEEDITLTEKPNAIKQTQNRKVKNMMDSAKFISDMVKKLK